MSTYRLRNVGHRRFTFKLPPERHLATQFIFPPYESRRVQLATLGSFWGELGSNKYKEKPNIFLAANMLCHSARIEPFEPAVC